MIPRALGLLALAACAQQDRIAQEESQRAAAESRPTATLAAPAAVATAEPHATRAAAEVLERGGNAVDAAIAAHFALAVTFPYAGNLGGGGFLLYRAPRGGAWFLDFREVAPAEAHRDLYLDEDGEPIPGASRHGWLAVGVPGAVPGMAEAHRRWGSLPWAELLQPAIALAREGIPVSAQEHARLVRAEERLSADPLARAIFYPDGAPLAEGALLVQPRLAETLDRIAAEGEAALRGGPLVEDLVARAQAEGGILTEQDFRDYSAVLRPVHRIRWRGLQILAPTAPSSAAVVLHQTLHALDGWPLAHWGVDDARTVQIVGEATAAAFRDRNRFLGDPAGLEGVRGALLDPAYLRARRAALDPSRYTPPDAELPAPPGESGQTTHFSVVDAAGGAVSCTTTLNGLYGAKVMAPGGFLMNNEMDDFAAAPGEPNMYGLVQSEANAVVPGRRPLSSMSPVIVLRDDEVDVVVGSPGGPTILSTVLQVLLHRYVFGMGPEASVAAPRFHRQDRPPEIFAEPGRLTAETRAALRALGQPLDERRDLGDVQALFRTDEGWTAVADPRGAGLGMTVAAPVAGGLRR